MAVLKYEQNSENVALMSSQNMSKGSNSFVQQRSQEITAAPAKISSKPASVTGQRKPAQGIARTSSQNKKSDDLKGLTQSNRSVTEVSNSQKESKPNINHSREEKKKQQINEDIKEVENVQPER